MKKSKEYKTGSYCFIIPWMTIIKWQNAVVTKTPTAEKMIQLRKRRFGVK